MLSDAVESPINKIPEFASPKILVIGGSAGAIETLIEVLPKFAVQWGLAVFIVVHAEPSSEARWIRPLGSKTKYKLQIAEECSDIRAGEITVARGDHHLVIEKGRVCSVRGPYENQFRPSIDVLFRSAAVHYGPQVMGLLLSGFLDDGCAGALALEACGGTCLVEDPDTCVFPDLPKNALRVLSRAVRVSRHSLPSAIEELLAKAVESDFHVPQNLVRENMMATQAFSQIGGLNQMGELAPMGCPECGGPLWALKGDPLDRHRCHIGHSHTLESLMRAKDDQINQALWVALRTLEERIRIMEKMPGAARLELSVQRSSAVSRLKELRMHAQVLRDLVMASNASNVHQIQEAPRSSLESQA